MQTRCPHCHSVLELDDLSRRAEVVCTACGRNFVFDDDPSTIIPARPVRAWPDTVVPPQPLGGRYELRTRLGAGAVGEVWKAYDLHLDRAVAVKLARTDTDRLHHEARAAATLQHPHLLRVLDAGQVDGRYFLVSEFVEGELLKAWAQAQESIAPQQAAALVAQLARAMQHAHDRGVIHRDLKPLNILIRASGEPFIFDFSLATRQGLEGRNEESAVAGTPAYMAPEQARGAIRFDQRVDVYSLGVILYELLTGQRPFEARSVAQLLQDAQHAEPRPPSGLNAAVPAALEAICLTCLQKDPARRFDSARELAEALERFLDDQPDLVPEARTTELERRVSELDRMLVTSQAEHQLYRSLVESLPLCVYRTDLEGRFVFANECFRKTMGVGDQPLVGKTPRGVFPEAVAARQQASDAYVLASGKVVEGREEHTSDGGLSTSFEVIKLPIRTFLGEIIGVQGLMLDVSAHARAEKALREAKKSAEDANAAKSMFLANVSHEIRTPMSHVIGLSDLLLKSDHSPETRRLLGLILQSAQSLLLIIDEILDFSKIEAGRIQLLSETFDLPELVTQIHATFALPVPQKEIAVALRLAPDVPRWVAGDPVRLRQVLVNLMGNALKFTERGQVILSVQREDGAQPKSAGPGQRVSLRFSVSDTGVGIAPEKRGVIFSPFEQADGGISRRFGGTGLGLAISSQLIRLMNGKIDVTSREGFGSVFHFTIELPVADAPPLGSAENQVAGPVVQERPLRILVAEDNAINQEVAAQTLRVAGHTVVLARNGQEAVEALERDAYDLVLMDLQMPVLDGLQATAEIRRREAARGRRTPIVAMTAHAMAEDRDKCLAAGMDGHLVKPLLVDALHQAVAGIFSRVSDAPPRPSPPATSAFPGRTFDQLKLLQQLGHDHAQLQRIVAVFLEDFGELQRKIEAALATGDAAALSQATHTLNGTLGYLHAGRARESARVVEQLARQGDLAGAAAAWRQLQADVAQLQSDIQQFAARAGSPPGAKESA